MATASEIASRYAFRENEADSDATLAQRELFYAFQDAFARARPSRVARKQRDLSTAFPLHYLNITKRPFRRKRDAVLTLPRDLRVLAEAQQSDGTWRPCPEVTSILEGNVGAIPRPPEGVSEWRWLTNLCVVYLQRQPEHFLALRECFERAGRWIEDKHLRHSAREALPPLPSYFFLDPTAVRNRQWRAAQDKLMEEKGYVAFTRTIRDQVATMRARPSSGSSLASRHTGRSRRSRRQRERPTSSLSRPRTGKGRGKGKGKGLDSRPTTAHTRISTVTGVSDVGGGNAGGGERRSSLTPAQQASRARHLRMLQTEWLKAGDVSSTLQLREEVRCFWRRASRWGNAEYSSTPHKARVVRVNDDGTANILFLDGARETLHNVNRRCVSREGGASEGVAVVGVRNGRACRYISRAGEHGFPAPGGVKPRYLKSRYEIMADRWGLAGTSFKQEMKELAQICDAAKRRPEWNSRHGVVAAGADSRQLRRTNALCRRWGGAHADTRCVW